MTLPDPSFRSVLLLVAGVCALGACGGSQKFDPRYPPREVGCDVKVFHGFPPSDVKHDDLGRVDAICTDIVAESDCIRELQDQACKMGGDLVYGVPVKPSQPTPDKVKFEGTAAHTRKASPNVDAPDAKKP
jgi:hypothetical protein